MLKYTIFRTEFGFFGLLSLNNAILRTTLPNQDYQSVESDLLFQVRGAQLDKYLLPDLQKQISSYFKGSYIEFSSEIPLLLDVLTDFSRDILNSTCKIPYGQTMTYSQIAELAGRPKAARAVGNALGSNPIPLIIPCHRVIKADQTSGGFMKNRPGAADLKKRMLLLEKTQM